MERHSLSGNLKHHSTGGGRSLKDNLNNNNNRVNKDSWEYSSSCSEMMSHGGGGGDLLSGFPWPPRCHTCSFCKREFRSAQALGGHMNVHRRERARLRQSPPPRDGHDHHQYPFLNLNLNPNPNPNTNSSPSQNPDHPSSSQSPSRSLTRFPSFTSTLLPLVSPPTSLSSLSLPPSSASPSEISKWVMEIDTDLAKIKSSETLLGAREFEGFAQGSGCEVLKRKIVGLDLEIGLCSDSKDDLDLELRLGRS